MGVSLEIVDLLGRASSLDLANLSASEATKTTAADLIRREKTVGLGAEETEELNQFLHVEHIMRLAMACARQRSS
jgi:hypothetical protein